MNTLFKLERAFERLHLRELRLLLLQPRLELGHVLTKQRVLVRDTATDHVVHPKAAADAGDGAHDALDTRERAECHRLGKRNARLRLDLR